MRKDLHQGVGVAGATPTRPSLVAAVREAAHGGRHPRALLGAHVAVEDVLLGEDAVLSELHIDRAYLSSELVRDRPQSMEVYCKAWRVANAGRYPKTAFALDWERGLLRCPAGVSMPFEVGGVVRFPKKVCAACHLRALCTKSKNGGRSVSIHPDERLLEELRERQRTPEGREKLRERVGV